ncbi:hypothetical protein SAMN05421505_10334 [Sinosporangium album]|uniref:Uncharacterized protein n=1 Tax=Sinosporangium album TaxID=504805 RepID=A0A1G7T195_9ACTN|nr:hypothetical protein SAMN05421505_10334 [Sinosporangium album]
MLEKLVRVLPGSVASKKSIYLTAKCFGEGMEIALPGT